MQTRYRDYHGCGVKVTTDGTHGKIKKSPGRLHGVELDLCSEHGLAFEARLTGRPDGAEVALNGRAKAVKPMPARKKPRGG